MSNSFSKRHGYEPEITVFDDAPPELKAYFLHLVYEIGLGPDALEKIICQILKRLPKQRRQWPGVTDIRQYNVEYLNECRWYKVYDVIEAVAKHYHQGGFLNAAFDNYQKDLNDFFIEHGIGWKLVDGRIEARGSELFEGALRTAKEAMGRAGHNTAERELHEAIGDLSRRPEPDVTGAIQHAAAALECVTRKITNKPTDTFGKLVNDNPGLFPGAMRQVANGIWGYVSQSGRHVEHGNEPVFDEAKLAVSICASVSEYLIHKSGKE
ncbi:hypothetical protein SAMN05216577_116112 [Pseudomonas citronellolis]|uniref:HEPN AbiJ-N-terminal domain-containing protein n=1 Tax=Pseudomonas citronellolis TaxID=53408 RepID=A0AAQ1HPL4_9PSED|nr:hypothetical protein [Pseudomonas citronellolis]TGC30050.1 hypothetical protein CW310_08645 [Pseudomonas citronellolis]SFD09425.1 hypothetical protein SAMN05216577_116112 [Pseudomonas citronellolis]